MTGINHKRHAFFASCPRGLEPLLQEEVGSLGAKDATATDGGVAFAGPFHLCYRVNLMSRIAGRVLWRVFHGPYRHEQDVYRAARGLEWPAWFTNRRTIKVSVRARECRLRSLDFVTLRIKDGVCDRFRAGTKARPSVETDRPDVRIHAFLDRTTLTLYLDTSGEPLFKRGLRRVSGVAPLRENLAAGILRLSGWTPEQTLLDPMCGSGTVLMEAAQIALNIAPGQGRSFGFEKLINYDAGGWRDLSEAARSRQRRHAPSAIYGSDLYGLELKQARINLQAAGLAEAVALKQADMLTLTRPSDAGIMVTNPPYGVRAGEAEELAALYPRLGDVLKQRFHGWRAYVLTADRRLPRLIGLACSRRTPLFNGPLECRLFEFKLVSGSMRRRKNAVGKTDAE